MTVEYRVVWQREGQAGKQSAPLLSREAAERHRALLMLRGMGWPPLVEVRIESREVGEWTAAS